MTGVNCIGGKCSLNLSPLMRQFRSDCYHGVRLCRDIQLSYSWHWVKPVPLTLEIFPFSGVWGCTPLIPSIGRQKQVTLEFKASLVFIVSFSSARATQWDPVSNKNLFVACKLYLYLFDLLTLLEIWILILGWLPNETVIIYAVGIYWGFSVFWAWF